jgi:ParB family transcriptional regulator, chromosome partitioning protein
MPCDLDGDRAEDEAWQCLDMVTANIDAYRENYTALEEATALFAAHEAGATRIRIRKVTSRELPEVKTALAAGSMSSGTREPVAGLHRQLLLGGLAMLADLEDDRGRSAERHFRSRGRCGTGPRDWRLT